MDAITFAVQLLNGVQYGLVLFLVASGLTLVFGILGVINLAHGAFYMLGAYLAWAIASYSGSFALALVGALAISFALGVALEEVFVKRMIGRDHLAQVLLSFGLILVIDEFRQILFGKDVHAVAPPSWLQGSIQLTEVLSYPVYRIALCLICLVMTRALGIPFDLVNRYVFAGGIALAALGGILVAPISTVFPGMGDGMLILSFVVVVLGGIGSVTGAAIGALLIGLTDTFGKVFFPQISSILIYVLMAGVLLWRPNGLLGKA
jgi:branched-chain amino acid transport system permease protein